MCELIFVNGHRADLNRILTLNLALEDSRTMNRDGWGIYTKEHGIQKTNIEPWLTSGFGRTIGENVSESPVIFHVRSASRGTEIRVDYNHPFETEHLVLAHNGTLTPKETLAGYEGKLDSEVFLLELEKEYIKDKKKDLVKSLQAVMERFTGKFAFLIYEKETETYYAVRGRTADLNIAYLLSSKGAITGYVINTVANNLGCGVDMSLEILSMQGRRIPLMSKIEELPIESIYLLGDIGVSKVGEIKQNEEPIVVGSYQATYWPNQYGKNHHAYRTILPGENLWDMDDTEDDLPSFPTSKMIDDLTSWMETYGMTIEDLDDILFHTLGEGILSCGETDIQTLLKHVFPKLTCKKAFREDYLRKVGYMGYDFMFKIYEKGGFQYPYILEPNTREFIKAVESALKDIAVK